MKGMKNLLILGAGAMVGNYVFERFIARADDGSGFIDMEAGFGLDDVIRALTVGAGIIVTKRAANMVEG